MDELLQLVNSYVVDPYILKTDSSTLSPQQTPHCPWTVDYSMSRQFFVLWSFLYTSSMVVYLLMATSTFIAFFVRNRHHFLSPTRHEYGQTRRFTINPAFWPWDKQQIKSEIWVSTWSLFLMSGLTAVSDMYILCGGAKIYHHISDYGWTYFIVSPILFLVFTDTLIYWIHRILHWPSVYWVRYIICILSILSHLSALYLSILSCADVALYDDGCACSCINCIISIRRLHLGLHSLSIL